MKYLCFKINDGNNVEKGSLTKYSLIPQQVASTEYTEELEKIGVLIKAKNFLVFQVI